ncbi:MAG: glycosyltransferase [Planctomycetes bacterium]|nr:glycosyltransferase [Planctomycetota bacterium]
MRPLTVVKVWFQNDRADTGLRDQRLARALLDDARVSRVVHLEPPVASASLATVRADDPTLLNARRRSAGVRDGRSWQLTPTWRSDGGGNGGGDPWRQVLTQVGTFLAEAGAFSPDSLLWVNAPSALGERIVATFGERFGRIVTELEDDHREYTPARSAQRLALERSYERLVRASDLLVGNNSRLLAEWARLQPTCVLARNAVDSREWATSSPEPSVLAGLPRPRFGYAGNLRLRLVPDLLRAVAQANPDAALLLAGVGGEALLPQLAGLTNVRWVGALPSRDVPAFLQHCDVLLMPHAIGPLTDSMDPQKVYEYLASGRPIVATPVAGARERGELLALAGDATEFVAAAAAALAERDPAASARRRAAGTARGWGDVAREVLDAALAVERPLERMRQEAALGYFQHDRPEVRALVPSAARRVLDVGCGAGALGAALQFERPHVEVTGIELDPRAAARASESLARVLTGDALARLAELTDQSFDVVLFADLLEHLADPEVALTQARRLLAPGGSVIASLPNVRHWSVVRQLLEGEFRYEPAGILDRTHLRFFTRQSAQRLFEASGFAVELCQGLHWDRGEMPVELVDALAAGGLDVATLRAESREHQWLFVAHAALASTAPAVARPAARTSVVIPVCNAADYTAQCLGELRLRGEGVLEVIVVDNGSTDATAELLARQPELRVIRNAENKGFAGAVNQGIAAARGELVCVLNNDTLLADGWLAPQVRLLDTDASIAMVGPVTSYAKGRQQIDLGEGTALPDLATLHRRAAAWCAREQGRIEDVAFLSGFCFTARRSELLPIGGLADAYGKGTFEDDELCRTFRRSGRRLVIARDAYVHHFGNRTFRALDIDLTRQQQENLRLFAQRHAGDPGLLARLCAEQGRWRDVLKLARAALAKESRDLDALMLAALAADALARPADAAKLAARYLDRCPHDVELQALAVRCENASGARLATRNAVPSGA